MSKIWKIKFYKNSDRLNDDYGRLSDIQKENVANLDIRGVVDYQVDDFHTRVIISDWEQIKTFSKILDDNLIEYDLQDISSGVLHGRIDISKEIEPHVNAIKFINFNKLINGWMVRNLEIDIVLDRINQVGMTGLKAYEKDFLQHYKQ